MFKFLIQRTKWITVFMGLIFFGLSQTELLKISNLWQRAEGFLIDRRYLLRGESRPHPDIKLLGIQASTLSLDALAPEEIAASPTLQLMQRPWPWDRRVYAAVLDQLIHAGARVVVFDLVFGGDTPGDEVFAETLQKYQGQVVIASMFSKAEGKYTPPNEKLLTASKENFVGLATFWSDADDVVRRSTQCTSWEQTADARLTWFTNNVISLSALAVERSAGRATPAAELNSSFIDFQGGDNVYQVFPLEQLFVEKLWSAPPFNSGAVFSNKIVVVGPIAEIFHDVHNTPFGKMSGAALQVQVMASLLRGTAPRPGSALFNLALAFAMMALALALCLSIRNAVFKAAMVVATVMLFLMGCQFVFVRHNLVVEMMPSLFCLINVGLFGIVSQFALEQFERRRYRNVLERYVSKNVAREILGDQRSFHELLRGRKKRITALFCDIRNFTTATENADPEKLVAQLNEYFLEMVEVVLNEGGTLQKFIGDGLMAVWGDTHSAGVENDACRAVRAALQMRATLEKLNHTWERNPDRRQFAFGIGINHGDVIVGNVGHPQRMEFTVLGDGVNVASRLESATKRFHTDILIGESVAALTRDQFVYRTMDLLSVAGRSQPVEVLSPISECSQPPPPWLATYHEGIKLYRLRQFQQATVRFQDTLNQAGDDYVCQLYIMRCAAFLQQPPPEFWDGSSAFAGK
jgi:adenylate cyclase